MLRRKTPQTHGMLWIRKLPISTARPRNYNEFSVSNRLVSERNAALVDAQARFLLVAMDDDGCGTPIYCQDESAVKTALLPLMFFLRPGESLSEEHAQEFDAQVEQCLENGGLTFEGDPPINLFKLHAARSKP